MQIMSHEWCLWSFIDEPLLVKTVCVNKKHIASGAKTSSNSSLTTGAKLLEYLAYFFCLFLETIDWLAALLLNKFWVMVDSLWTIYTEQQWLT